MGVFFGDVQVIGGSGITASSLMKGNVIGVIAGATLMFHGFGTMAEKLDGVNFSEKYYEDASQFLGFSRGLGKLSHQVVDLSTSFYGLAKLTLIEKPNTPAHSLLRSSSSVSCFPTPDSSMLVIYFSNVSD
ncbi:TPA: DUF4225 domain-containing protein [Klebsiella aerogenes]